MVKFSHLDPGTSAVQWKQGGLRELPALPLDEIFTQVDRLIVISAHPDDETLGAGGLIQLAQLRQVEVTVLVCTNGEASHPHSPTIAPQQLSQLRALEMEQAVKTLQLDEGPRIRLRMLGLPDGQLASHRGQLLDELRQEADSGCFLVSTYRGDGHTDHEQAAAATAQAAQELGLFHLEFPLWYWQWAQPGTHEQWRHWHRLPLDPALTQRKQSAMAEHLSQTRPLSGSEGDEALLSSRFLEHFSQPWEIFRMTQPGQRNAATAEVFEDLYQRKGDPWEYRSSAYEQRKREILLASLPRRHYKKVLELGCSIGVQTAELAGRCSSLVGVDSSPTALQQARRAVSGLRHVELLLARLPDQWPELDASSVDLIVLSEIGYFLAADELAEVLRLSAEALCPGGELLLCHWLHPIEGWPLDGADVHAMAQELRWPTVVLHEEKDFLLAVLRKPGGNG